MRILLIVIAALATLGLAAFGVVAGQRATAPAVPIVQSADTAPALVPVKHVAATPAASLEVPMTAPSEPAAPPVSAAAALQAPITAPAIPAPTPVAPIRVAQNTPRTADPRETVASAEPGGTPSAVSAIPACAKPGGLGLSRIVEIDTTDGPAFGFEHFKQYDFLAEHEVVLTFDDGPWPENTRAVLKALTDNCVKATFFEIGEHATWHPELSRELAAAGMTIGTHTWSHKDLARNPYAGNLDLAKQEIEMGISAVHFAVDGPIAPFFRFPDLQQPPALLTYLGSRNIATFSTDIDSFDFKLHRPAQVIESVMTKLKRRGKGIVLMHDFQHATGEAMPELLRQLKLAGFKVVHLVPSKPLSTLAKYDEMVRQQDKLSVNNTRPARSVFHTIGEYVGSPAPGVGSGD